MGHGHDICPKCGCDLWHEYAEVEKEKQRKKYPDNCYCFSFDKRGKRDNSKDTFVERKTIKGWTNALNPTPKMREVDIYKCHICGKEYIYPEIYYA